jgi:hypothetical protein
LLNCACARALARNPALAGLRCLTLAGNNLGAEGARALAASPHLQKLELLDLTNNGIPPETQRWLKERLGNRVRYGVDLQEK